MKEEREPVREVSEDDPMEASLKQLFMKSVGTARRGWRCLDEERLAAFFEGKLNNSERTRSEAHLSSCDYCLGQLGFLAREERKPPAEVPAHMLARVRMLAPAPSLWSPNWKWALVTSTAVIILAVGLARNELSIPAPIVPNSTPQAPVASVPKAGAPVPPKTAGETPIVRRNGARTRPELLSPLDGAELLHPIEFKWKPVANALFYEVRISREDGSLQWEGQSDKQSLRPAPEAALEPGKTYYVVVVAHLADGRRESSIATPFHVSTRK